MAAEETTVRSPQVAPARESPPVDPQREAFERFWDEFTAADYPRQIELFTDLLPDREQLDAELAFEMINVLYSKACEHNDFTRFEILIEALREQRPDVYEEHAHYYLEWRIEAALIEGRRDDADRLARQLAALAGEHVDVFHWAEDQLAYYGLNDTLRDAARIAWPGVRESSDILPWAKDAFAERGAQCEIADALACGMVDVNRLAQRLRFYLPDVRLGVVRRVVEHVPGTVQQMHDPKVVLADYSPESLRRRKERGWDADVEDQWDEDEWEENTADPELAEEGGDEPADELKAMREPPPASSDEDEADDIDGDHPRPLTRLSYDFLGYLWREEAMPLAKAELARIELVDYLSKRKLGQLAPGQSMLDSMMRRPKPKPHRKPLHPLCPDRGTLDVFLGGLIGDMFWRGVHAAAALAEVLPAWLVFLEERGAIDAKLHAKVLLDVTDLMNELAEAIGKLQSDPHLAENIRRAWRIAAPPPAPVPVQ